MPLQPDQKIAAADPCLGEVGSQRERLVVGDFSLLIAEEAIEDIAAGDPGRGKVGIDGERFVVGGLLRLHG